MLLDKEAVPVHWLLSEMPRGPWHVGLVPTPNSVAVEGDLRLSNGAMAADGSAEYGRLEVFHNGGWGTVCDRAFVNRNFRGADINSGSADVACRVLGYQNSFQIQNLVRSTRAWWYLNASDVERTHARSGSRACQFPCFRARS